MNRVCTGIEGLDQLLCGGILRGDSLLVAGAPGTGKTSLGMQVLHHGANTGEPGLLITFEEFPQQIYRDALSFGWDFRQLEEDNKLKVLFTSPELLREEVLREEGIVNEMIRELGARLVVVDSISQFRSLAGRPEQFREIIYGLLNAFRREQLTTIFITEIAAPEHLAAEPEEFLTDAIVLLSSDQVEGQRMRFLEVLKSRGSKHLPLRTLFFITECGLTVLPSVRGPFFRSEEAVSTGLSQLDDLLGGGIPYGGFYLLEHGPQFRTDAFAFNFMRETVAAGDVLVHVSGDGHRGDELLNLARAGRFLKEFEAAKKAGNVHLLAAKLPEATHELEKICREAAANSKVRLQLRLSGLLTTQSEEAAFALLTSLLESIRRHSGVAFGLLDPEAVGEAYRGRVRLTADGLIRIWNEGNHDYLQVTKTLNSTRTPICALVETSQPPFLEIVSY